MRFTMKRNHFKIGDSEWLENHFTKWSEVFFLAWERIITSLIFPTGISYWENQIHLWALIFGSQNLPVLHMFLTYRSRENENEFPKVERGFCSQQTNIKKTISFYTHVSHIWRTKYISEPQFFNSLAKFLGQKLT